MSQEHGEPAGTFRVGTGRSPAAEIAHEFNNILATMLGYLDIMRELGQVSPQGIATLEKVLAAGERAKELTKRLAVIGRQAGD